MTTNGGQGFLEEVKNMLESGELPEKVDRRLTWAALVNIYRRQSDHEKRLSSLEKERAYVMKVLTAAWGVITFGGGIAIKEVLDYFLK